MIDIATEKVVTLSAGSRYLRERLGGKRVHPSTLYRWAVRGLKADDGTLVRLEVIRVGARTLATSVEAIQRYCERLSRRGAQSTPPSARGTSSRDAARACRQLGL